MFGEEEEIQVVDAARVAEICVLRINGNVPHWPVPGSAVVAELYRELLPNGAMRDAQNQALMTRLGGGGGGSKHPLQKVPPPPLSLTGQMRHRQGGVDAAREN